MILLLGTGIGVLVMGVAAGARHRARTRWESPYADLARAMAKVTRTEGQERHQPSGLVGLRPAGPSAQVVLLTHARAARVGHPSAH